MSITSVFGLMSSGDSLISLPALVPNSLETSKSLVVKGDCFIKGNASCVTIRGAEMGVPVVLCSDFEEAAAPYDEWWFTSPINGMIRSVGLIGLAELQAVTITIYYYNSDGVRATTFSAADALTARTLQTDTFDWEDSDDYVFCRVGIGSSFCARVEADGGADHDIALVVTIDPLTQGGRYV